jgi:hypothetical protein
MAKVQVDRTEQDQRQGEAGRPLPGEEARRGRLRKATRRPVWAAAAIVLAMTLVGTAGSAQAASERRESLSGIATGEETRLISLLPGEVLLMRGFDFRYLNGDHHIETVGVLPETDTSLAITFRDRNGDDPMEYEVSLTKVALPGVISPPTLQGSCSGGTCTFPLQAPPNDHYIFFLRGFRLTFLPDEPGFPFPGNCDIFVGCDHHLSIVGIQKVSGNNIEVTYQDQNGDDDYAVAIDYSYVPRSLVNRLVTVNGTVDDAGTDHKDLRGGNSGAVAITGFRIGYVPVPTGGFPTTRLPDNHILRFSYQLTSTGVDVAFHDNDPDTKWEYQLNFARFR